MLLLPVIGLPIAVFLAWKEPVANPPLPPAVRHETRNAGGAWVETMPGDDIRGENAPAPAPESPSAVPPEVPPDPSSIPGPPSPQPEALAVAPTSENPPPPATPPPPMLDWAEIATRPAQWPPQTQTKVPVDFPISVEGKRSGSTRIPAGANVKVVKISQDGAEIAFAEYSTKVALDQTTLGEQMASNPPSVPQVPEQPSEPLPSQKADAPPKSEGTTLNPQQNWRKPAGDQLANLIELLKVLEHDTQADKSLEILEHPEISKGVTLMMPLREALVQLGLGKDLIPSKSPVAHPGIPLFFRTFPCKYSLVGKPEDYFNLLCIITDAEDRVVGIQFVCENPRSKMHLPKEDFLTCNFLLNRRKSATALKVGCEVTESGGGALLIESWLFDERRDKCLEIVRLYLPKRIANFLRYVIESRLDLSE